MTHERSPVGPRVFNTREERDAWQIQTYGKVRNGYREPGEPSDERPVLRRDSFWDDVEEPMLYLTAVRENPIGSQEGHLSYIQRVAETVRGERMPLKVMPNVPPVEDQRLPREPGEDA